jgi:hypothetical protein
VGACQKGLAVGLPLLPPTTRPSDITVAIVPQHGAASRTPTAFHCLTYFGLFRALLLASSFAYVVSMTSTALLDMLSYFASAWVSRLPRYMRCCKS